MRTKSKLEAPLNAKDFHPPFGMSLPAALPSLCASAVLKEHHISYEWTMAINAAPRTMGRIARTWRA